MKFITTHIKDLYIIELEPFTDNRGMFSRIYCKNELKEIGHTKEIVNINHSLTKKKGALRGLHFQYPPKAEIKIVKCIKGSIYDVAIDLRKNSPSFLNWFAEILSSKNMKMLYIPEGFAHGFQTLEDNCELIYFHSEFYSPEYEGGINYKDPQINIKWPLDIMDISKRDQNFDYITNRFEGLDL